MAEGLSIKSLGRVIPVKLVEDCGDGFARVKLVHNGARRRVAIENIFGWPKAKAAPVPGLPPPLPVTTRPFDATSARPVPKPPKPTRSRSYLDFVRAQPCCVCGAPPRSHAHHHGPHAMGQKTDDHRCVPLCDVDHDALHAGNRPQLDDAFFAKVQRELLVAWCREEEVPGV